MGGFLEELGKRLAERWLSLLVVPGFFYLAVAAGARALGQSHALDLFQLIRSIAAWAKTPTVTSTSGQVVIIAAVLAGSGGAGLVTQCPWP